ncbi:hypothetical protein ACLS0R_16450 [Comamonas jiangduensis]|uniref:hypothetical protein n=1 Tax=Comamonas jiangduensis TaxID=1194168 RepID=UPI003BF86F45
MQRVAAASQGKSYQLLTPPIGSAILLTGNDELATDLPQASGKPWWSSLGDQ